MVDVRAELFFEPLRFIFFNRPIPLLLGEQCVGPDLQAGLLPQGHNCCSRPVGLRGDCQLLVSTGQRAADEAEADLHPGVHRGTRSKAVIWRAITPMRLEELLDPRAPDEDPTRLPQARIAKIAAELVRQA